MRAALAGRDGTLREVLDVVVAYERGDWDILSDRCRSIGLDEAEAPLFYYDSLEWAKVTFD